ncbi:hypothetical protein BsWGS_24782 [Bradybaena similaris]
MNWNIFSQGRAEWRKLVCAIIAQGVWRGGYISAIVFNLQPFTDRPSTYPFFLTVSGPITSTKTNRLLVCCCLQKLCNCLQKLCNCYKNSVTVYKNSVNVSKTL